MDFLIKNWKAILENMRDEHEISKVPFVTWLEPLEIHSVEGNILYILVKEQQIIDVIKKKYYLMLKVSIAEFTGIDYEIEFITAGDDSKISDTKETNNIIKKAGLNPNYTFDTFVVGENNRLAHSASLAVADDKPGRVYNPLFLYGGVGLGKTHLMQSIAHYILEQNPDCKVLYTTSEAFTNDIIDSIGTNKKRGDNEAISQVREKYRNIDVLLIDDIQFIIGKERTQEEFFHTFNDLQMANKQIIITSDKPPKEMNILNDRIITRFEMGLTVDIGSPDFETRVAILRKKAYNINDDVIDYIASNIKSNVRELEGALNKLVAFNRLNGEPITLELAQKELKDYISPDIPKTVTMELIAKTVASHFSITVDDLMSKKRNSYIAKPRHITMYLCYNMINPNPTLKDIGEYLGGRNYATVINGINNVTNEIESNVASTMQALDMIKKKIVPE